VFNECGLEHRFTIADFYPLHWKETPKLLFAEFFDEVAEKIANAPFVHLWGATLREIGFNHGIPPAGSYMEFLYRKYLDPHVAAQLSPLDEGEFRKSVKTYVESTWNISLPLTR
jgi:hypothetical protein